MVAKPSLVEGRLVFLDFPPGGGKGAESGVVLTFGFYTPEVFSSFSPAGSSDSWAEAGFDNARLNSKIRWVAKKMRIPRTFIRNLRETSVYSDSGGRRCQHKTLRRN